MPIHERWASDDFEGEWKVYDSPPPGFTGVFGDTPAPDPEDAEG